MDEQPTPTDLISAQEDNQPAANPDDTTATPPEKPAVVVDNPQPAPATPEPVKPVEPPPVVVDPTAAPKPEPAQPQPEPQTPAPAQDVKPPAQNKAEIPKPTKAEPPTKEKPRPILSQPLAATQPQPSEPADYSKIDISKLSADQLKSAAALHAKRNQKSISSAGVKARQATARKNIAAIIAYVNGHSPTNGASIARALNMRPRRVQHYMQILVKNGTVTATGWAQSRKYYKK